LSFKAFLELGELKTPPCYKTKLPLFLSRCGGSWAAFEWKCVGGVLCGISGTPGQAGRGLFLFFASSQAQVSTVLGKRFHTSSCSERKKLYHHHCPQVSALLSELVLYLFMLTWQPQRSLQQAPSDTLTPHRDGGPGVFQLL